MSAGGRTRVRRAQRLLTFRTALLLTYVQLPSVPLRIHVLIELYPKAEQGPKLVHQGVFVCGAARWHTRAKRAAIVNSLPALLASSSYRMRQSHAYRNSRLSGQCPQMIRYAQSLWSLDRMQLRCLIYVGRQPRQRACNTNAVKNWRQLHILGRCSRYCSTDMPNFIHLHVKLVRLGNTYLLYISVFMPNRRLQICTVRRFG